MNEMSDDEYSAMLGQNALNSGGPRCLVVMEPPAAKVIPVAPPERPAIGRRADRRRRRR